ncbi:hypothetical protein WA1_49190 [Scytonema hofmannii PCC 7110]|uniref:Uncharacterized protein n=1 Tax=Scytonema hofmannii PCC 7110 TaxID=128403 RepID=A0A139WQK6_9CYAN|nr:hypothetical protein [Scytonema hofmannii]KYC34718.1 hypothetical protein WA1_49190 [Scytonema hofmannii PCC 7110]
MKRASILLVGILSGIALANFPNTALANTIRTIKTSQVSGENAQLQTVQVWPGHGVSISFFKTEETIKRIWLDDPSRFLIDVDGCLEGLSRSNCRNPGAGMVHIRRINDVKIPGMPKATNGAHLTIVTESSGGKRSHYHFRIVPGSGTPQYSSLEIVGDIKEETQQQQLPKPQPSPTAIANSSLLARGMQVALTNNWIETDSPLWQRLNTLIENLQSGEDMTIAATNAGVSMRLVSRLMQLGGFNPLPAPKPSLLKVPPTTSPYVTNTSR